MGAKIMPTPGGLSGFETAPGHGRTQCASRGEDFQRVRGRSVRNIADCTAARRHRQGEEAS
jgi:hypothetical protein